LPIIAGDASVPVVQTNVFPAFTTPCLISIAEPVASAPDSNSSPLCQLVEPTIYTPLVIAGVFDGVPCALINTKLPS
jgi:hypothetical protein